MNELENRTHNGKPLTAEYLEALTAEAERDWDPSEFRVVTTDYGKAITALQFLGISVEKIEALERRAKHANSTLPDYLRIVLQDALVG